MAYGDYLQNICNKFEKNFSEISAQYNFDLGDEFEIALCKTLRAILPAKYGICRGFAVTSTGETVGDDIFIFDQQRLPTFRLLDEETYAQKEYIPIEAIYAYIEAKHTMYLEGTGGQSISKACKQIEAVKNLKRKDVPLTQVTPIMNFEHMKFTRDDSWPQILNPFYGAIIARNIQIKKDGKDDIEHILTILKVFTSTIDISSTKPPDLIIADYEIVCLPTVNTQIRSPFYKSGTSKLSIVQTDKTSFGIGICALLYAIDSITLGNIFWPKLLSDGLNVKLTDDESINW